MMKTNFKISSSLNRMIQVLIIKFNLTIIKIIIKNNNSQIMQANSTMKHKIMLT